MCKGQPAGHQVLSCSTYKASVLTPRDSRSLAAVPRTPWLCARAGLTLEPCTLTIRPHTPVPCKDTVTARAGCWSLSCPSTWQTRNILGQGAALRK